ncbi:MAG: hypothetical protein ACP5P3_05315 [Ignavibacteria bacterium]
MEKRNFLSGLLAISFTIIFALFSQGCKENATEPTELTDEEYVKQVVLNGYDNSAVEDNLISQERTDFDDGAAVPDDDSGPIISPLDSLKRWGRIITGNNININVEDSGDTLKIVHITRTINGYFRIIGYKNGQLDSVNKPYTQVFTRNVEFKRIGRSPYPRLNWRLYRVSCLDGQTTQPQIGSDYVMITKVEFYKNGSPLPILVLNGPDFQNFYFTTAYFGGSGIPSVNRGDQVTIKVYTTSQLSDPDYVAFHWAKNTFGFHRKRFQLESQTGSGPYYRIYSKTFNIYSQHRLGVFNGSISASTKESLYDDDISKFASDQVTFPYKVLQ